MMSDDVYDVNIHDATEAGSGTLGGFSALWQYEWLSYRPCLPASIHRSLSIFLGMLLWSKPRLGVSRVVLAQAHADPLPARQPSTLSTLTPSISEQDEYERLRESLD
ncbi:hypothetical protein ASPCADRAFT_206790 [Aspergillus carbonarius ITEM 5010]|uniref:Uncharacterized protein n=1 Tax=Aspergillus carbonarius (strain ITEM 5010) TaxID=602072 RepID=A0A1R3RQ38_ASPC5|nr:hypothetical protein ASPCADRAFT_206790 [Aspergillus carbonarius ITEM 5010]